MAAKITAAKSLFEEKRGRSSVISVVIGNRQTPLPFCEIPLPPSLTPEEHYVPIYSFPWQPVLECKNQDLSLQTVSE